MISPYAEVIGDPIDHSRSPAIYRFWLEKLGIDGDYRSRRVGSDDLAAYFAERGADPGWCGCNVTLPHKLATLDHVEDRGGLRASIGAVNTVLREEHGTLIGTNTDAAGFYAPISGIDLKGLPVAVVGAGGAARAVLFALARAGAGPVTVLNRTPLRAAGLLGTFGLKGEALPLGAPLPAAGLLVNASPLGMTGQPPLDLNLSPLPEEAVVYDLVYAPVETPLLATARAHGLDTVDGTEMLVAQAAIAFELFFGEVPPRESDGELRERLAR